LSTGKFFRDGVSYLEMKKISILLLLIIVGLILQRLNPAPKYFFNQNNQLPRISSSVTPSMTSTSLGYYYKSLFLPSWQLKTSEALKLSGYDRVLFFGLTPNQTGISQDTAYFFLSSLKNLSLSKGLVIKMINDEINDLVLNNNDVQDNLINQTIALAKENQFSDIALDIELFSLFPTEKKIQINNFVNKFYARTKENDLKLSLILYGDTIYRKKIFDLEYLDKYTDEIFIMAYDFHKSGGEPGPNFPLRGKEKYGYDFQTMIEDYLSFIKADKITVIFGMYGYQWVVDEQKRPLKRATALTLNNIKDQFIKNCNWQDCVIKRDELSQETEINFINSRVVDGIGRVDYHVIWFEDEQSVKAKTDYLNTKGIRSTAFWAYGYF